MNYNTLIDAVKASKTIAIFCHKNPDGDTLGSGLALFAALAKLKKRVDIFCEDTPPENFKDMPISATFNNGAEKRYDLSIAVDAGDEGRLGTMFDRFLTAKKTIVIDHHKTNTRYGDINVVETNVSACAEVVYSILLALSVDIGMPLISKPEASCLYVGLLTDSGGFSFQSVTENTFKIAAELVVLGAEPGELAYKYMKRTKKKVYDLRLRVLNNAMFYSDAKIAVLHFKRLDFEATGTSTRDTEGVINIVLNLDTVKIAITIADFLDAQYKVSFRSKGDIDVSRVAATFGGGGHKNASGCQLFGCYEEALERILKAAGDAVYEF